MVLVTVGDEDAANLLLALHHVREVRKDEVDTGVVVIREHDSGVYEDDVVPVLEDGHVLADTVESPEWDDSEAIGLFAPVLLFDMRVGTSPLSRECGSFGRTGWCSSWWCITAAGKAAGSLVSDARPTHPSAALVLASRAPRRA